MARRRELLDIARGISSSFNSRNNDFQGYWALGVLYKFVSTNNIDSLEFDILNSVTHSSAEDFYQVISRYNALLRRLLKIKNINYAWVKSASIKIYFNQYSEVHYKKIFYPFGDPYIVTVKLIDDRGKIFKSNMYGKCRYHDPNKEFKRA